MTPNLVDIVYATGTKTSGVYTIHFEPHAQKRHRNSLHSSTISCVEMYVASSLDLQSVLAIKEKDIKDEIQKKFQIDRYLQ